MRVDQWAQGRPWRRNVCECPAYHYPHRKGSGSCVYNLADREAFEERAAIKQFDAGLPADVAEREAALEQPPKEKT